MTERRLEIQRKSRINFYQYFCNTAIRKHLPGNTETLNVDFQSYLTKLPKSNRIFRSKRITPNDIFQSIVKLTLPVRRYLVSTLSTKGVGGWGFEPTPHDFGNGRLHNLEPWQAIRTTCER